MQHQDVKMRKKLFTFSLLFQQRQEDCGPNTVCVYLQCFPTHTMFLYGSYFVSERILIRTEEYQHNSKTLSTDNEEEMFNGSRGSQWLCVAPDSHCDTYQPILLQRKKP